jgi:predicted LPLAT superfamily acyltransferase
LETESSQDQTRGTLLDRIGIYGDVPTRLMEWGIRTCPLYLEPLFILGYSLLCFVLCRGARRAVCANLAVIFPGASRIRTSARAFRVFWNFAWSCADAARVRIEGDVLDWDIVGIAQVDELADLDGGAIVLTAHMGNYDVAAPVFARRFKKKFHAVRAPERVAAMQEMMEEQHSRTASSDYEVRYNTGDNFLAVDLMNALSANEIVALQGDRLIPGLTPLPNDLFGAVTQFPKGPFSLAAATGVPIYPIFVIRTGRRRYQVRVDNAFYCQRNRKAQDHALQSAAATWAEVLATVVRKHWYQWYVFEPAFGAPPSTPPPAQP